MRAVFLLVLSACTAAPQLGGPDTFAPDALSDAPPPSYVSLDGPIFATVGGRYDLVLTDGIAGERAVLAVGSEEGEGPCARRIGGYCVDLLAPVSQYANAITGVDGRAVFELIAPPWADTRYCFQAVVPRGPSGIATALSDVVCVDYCAAEDEDGDGVCDAFDACPGGDDRRDADGDGICDLLDLCPGEPGEPDEDGDGICDAEDVCPGGIDADLDGDGILDGCDYAPMANEVAWGDHVYAAIDDTPVDSDYGAFGSCQTTPMPLPDGWEVAPDVPGIDDFIYDHGWSTHCMILADGCAYGTYNYGLGGCSCGVLGTDGVNYWAASCSRRVLIRRPG